MRQVGYIFIILMAFLKSFSLPAQTSVALDEMRRGDALKEKYRFQEASEAYLKASESFVDSLLTADDSLLKLDITDRLLMAENGLSMMDFVFVPMLLPVTSFPLKIFSFIIRFRKVRGARSLVSSTASPMISQKPHMFLKDRIKYIGQPLTRRV